MSVGELKSILRQHGVASGKCVEKAELVTLVSDRVLANIITK